MPRVPANFEINVFINCPFDDLYTPLLNAIVFTVQQLGFKPRCALETSNAGQFRLNKIMDIISQCKYSIHDLSRTELDKATDLPRFNMPLELGLDLGCRRFGRPHHKRKVCLILDIEPYRYQKFISDISGQDIYAHRGDEQQVTKIVRDWLRLGLDPQIVKIPSGQKVFQRYQDFQKALPVLCAKFDLDLTQLLFADFSFVVAAWLSENPL